MVEASPPPLTIPDSALVATVRPSPNHGSRREGIAPDALVLHYTGMADGPSAVAWLCDPRSQVSCHYVVLEDGSVLQLVAEARRAWHAGRSSWAGETDLNGVSIGIEIVNPGHAGGLPPYPPAQVAAVIRLCRDIVARHAIAPGRVLAHSDIAPGRKEDPGERFPWDVLAAAGVGLWVMPPPFTEAGSGVASCPALGVTGESVVALQQAFAAFGYGLAVTGTFDLATEAVVKAFQRRFRPARVDGQFDPQTARILADLAALGG